MSVIITFFFLALIPYASNAITFSFKDITPNHIQEITLSGDAAYSTSGGEILVTNGKNTTNAGWQHLAGRATYIEPLHLWDNESTELASFSTSFRFVINVHMAEKYASGLTFFLAQDNSVINDAEDIGLPFDNRLNVSVHPFVAVEFDSFGVDKCDPTDPITGKAIDDHVGININSMNSVVYRKWFSDITHGRECRALIEYDSDSKILSVSFTSFKDDLVVWETGLNYTVDLRDVLPEWVIFGFSGATGDRFEENIVRSWTFNSTEFKSDRNIILNNAEKRENKVGIKVGLIIGPLVVVIVLSLMVYFWVRRKKNVTKLGSALEIKHEFDQMEIAIPRRFSYLELARSTAKFAESEKLGEGGFGGVYKGFLKDLSVYVAVKRVSNNSNQGVKEYASEVRIINQLRHRNLVQLIGWCHEKHELLLVYEFLENGSLDLHLFKGKSLLSWNTRYKIVCGLASGLIYLHEEWDQCVLHRDIKSSNVMLDSSFNAKLGDFGLAKLVDHQNGAKTTNVAGTIGYMAPEYVMSGKPSKESDVFSFGVVALEIACGRRAIDLQAEERKTKLVEWVWDLYGTKALLEAADPSLGSSFVKEEMRCLMIVGLWCAHPDSKQRPSMKQAIQVLNFETSLPVLPSKMPDVSYYALSDFALFDSTLSSDTNTRSSMLSTT